MGRFGDYAISKSIAQVGVEVLCPLAMKSPLFLRIGAIELWYSAAAGVTAAVGRWEPNSPLRPEPLKALIKKVSI